jgi:hypothetical protein
MQVVPKNRGTQNLGAVPTKLMPSPCNRQEFDIRNKTVHTARRLLQDGNLGARLAPIHFPIHHKRRRRWRGELCRISYENRAVLFFDHVIFKASTKLDQGPPGLGHNHGTGNAGIESVTRERCGEWIITLFRGLQEEW